MLKLMTFIMILSGVAFSSEQAENIEITKDSDILIYTAFFWAPCKEAKSLLRSRGIDFRERMITFSRKNTKEMAKVTNGHTSIPQILVDGKYFGGLNKLKEYFTDVPLANWLDFEICPENHLKYFNGEYSIFG